VSHESAVGAPAEAASASSTSVTDSLQLLSENGLVDGGDDRTPPPHLAENSDDSSIESLHVSRRSGGAVRFSMTDLVSQISMMSAADRAILRTALGGDPSPPPASVQDVGGGSLAPPARDDGGVACAGVSASSSGSSIIPAAPVHPLGNGVSGGQLLPRSTGSDFESRLDQCLAADPRIPCPPPARAALLRLNERGIDAI
jgi:hypothetical protein